MMTAFLSPRSHQELKELTDNHHERMNIKELVAALLAEKAQTTTETARRRRHQLVLELFAILTSDEKADVIKVLGNAEKQDADSNHDDDGMAGMPVTSEAIASALTSSVIEKPATRDPTDIQLRTAEVALACLVELQAVAGYKPHTSALVAAVHYTDPNDTWSTVEAARNAVHLLASGLSEEEAPRFAVECLLKEYLRPIFSGSSSRVTPSGRPSQAKEFERSSVLSAEEAKWKEAGLQVVTDLQWVMLTCNAHVVSTNWPLFIPSIVTLVEDLDVPIRGKGLGVLASFITKCHSDVLELTGLTTVFQDMLFPLLLFLPGSATEDESLRVIEPTYRALIVLAQKSQDDARCKILDKVLREGIFTGHVHAAQYARTVVVFMRYTKAAATSLGISAVKHLQSLIDFLASVMTDPFSATSLPSVLEASEALRAVVETCWMRLSEPQYIDQVLRIIVICWTNLEDQDAEMSASNIELREVIWEVLEPIATFLAASRPEGWETSPSGTQWNAIVENDNRLAAVFSGPKRAVST